MLAGVAACWRPSFNQKSKQTKPRIWTKTGSVVDGRRTQRSNIRNVISFTRFVICIFNYKLRPYYPYHSQQNPYYWQWYCLFQFAVFDFSGHCSPFFITCIHQSLLSGCLSFEGMVKKESVYPFSFRIP